MPQNQNLILNSNTTRTEPKPNPHIQELSWRAMEDAYTLLLDLFSHLDLVTSDLQSSTKTLMEQPCLDQKIDHPWQKETFQKTLTLQKALSFHEDHELKDSSIRSREKMVQKWFSIALHLPTDCLPRTMAQCHLLCRWHNASSYFGAWHNYLGGSDAHLNYMDSTGM
ncbi:hypothetical protein GDO81_012657 [Engystomops pustulosus]|uniref:Uncharacterized protein n=1 Tax=Engystomops pustulosus TaxID=76066 RepID=A0AAV7ATW0_ENGPU|nr:hypothetical protein GDO81_012657 [Engystomops pustulosus]